MRGYLLREQVITPGTDTFIDCVSEENNYAVVFEDNQETGYFYAMEFDKQTNEQRILDALLIYQLIEDPQPAVLKIIWATDWLKCALIIDEKCQAVFDFENQGGYCRHEFPPPNNFWTKGERKLDQEKILELFK